MLKQLQHSGIKRTIITGNNFLKRVGENFFATFQVANQNQHCGATWNPGPRPVVAIRRKTAQPAQSALDSNGRSKFAMSLNAACAFSVSLVNVTCDNRSHATGPK